MTPGGVRQATYAESGRIMWIDPGSWIKNMVAISVIMAVVWTGLSMVIGMVSGSLAQMPGMQGGFAAMGASQALGFVINVVAAAVGACISVLVFNLVAKWTKGVPLRFKQAAAWPVGLQELRRVTPFSALKVGAVIGAVFGIVAGLIVLVVFQGLGSAFSNMPSSGPGGSNPFASMSPGTIGVGMALAMPVFYAIAMGVSFVIWSLLYNALSNAWGGIKFECGSNYS